MKLSIDYNSAKYTIKAYKKGSVTINNEQYSDSLIVTPDELVNPWEPDDLQQLTQAHISAMVEMKPEIILLGTGELLRFPHPSIMSVALQQGIGFEVMDTGSACRTFNVLASEDRKVLAAILMV